MIARLLALLLALPLTAEAEEMHFDFACLGNAVEGCYVIAKGQIVADTPQKFTAFMQRESPEGNKVLLESHGGSLAAGVTLGRMFRAREMHTVVGNGAPVIAREGFPDPAICASACAYAFLGGQTRTLPQGSQLGFHRFFIPGTRIDEASAQSLSGELISYIVAMGVDARVFSLASTKGEDEMHYVSPEEAEAYELITPYGYQAFFLEPYGKGVVAASKRKTRTEAYDLVVQMTAFCKKGEAKLLFHAPQHGLDHAQPEELILTHDGQRTVVPASRSKIRVTKDGAYIETRLSPAQASSVANATKLGTAYRFPRVVGGSYGAYFELSDMDRSMLSAAFRLCL